MGQLHFELPGNGRLPEAFEAAAYLTNAEGIPWRTRCSVEESLLTADRPGEESSQIHCPWNTKLGRLMLSSTTLMQRPQPYRLSVELARGVLHRTRTYLAAGEAARAAFSDEVYNLSGEAAATFVRAVTAADANERETAAAEAIEQGLAAGRLLTQQYARHVLHCRTRDGQKLNLPYAVDLGEVVPDAATATRLAEAFNTVSVPLTWSAVSDDEGTYRWDRFDRQVQAARQAGLRVCLGPLLALDKRSVPDWLCLWEGDLEALEQSVGQYVEAVVRRYQKHVAVWHVAGRLNVHNSLSLNEEDVLRLALAATAAVRRIDSRTPTLVSLDQPWAEYLARQGGDLSPLHLADWLARSEVGVSGIGIEIDFEWGGSAPRDLLETSLLLDRWSLLGKPLVVFVSLRGSAEGEDSAGYAWQAAAADDLLSLLISRPAVQAVIWNQLADTAGARLPHAGLLDSQGRAKPAYGRISALRKQFIV